MIIAPHNNLFVEIDSEYNDEYKTKTGTTLYLTTQQFTSDDTVDNSNFKPTMIRKHYGVVIGLPLRLTTDVKITQIDPGLPAPGRYLSNESVAGMLKYASSWDCLNSFEYEWKTSADLEMEVKIGDKIYFHHNTVTNDNLVSEIGPKVYKLGYSNAICVVRYTPAGIEVTHKCTSEYKCSNGDSWSSWEVLDTKPFDAKTEIIPVAAHILVEPLWEEGVEDLGNGQRGKLSKFGIVSELHDHPEPLRGKVVATSSPFKGEKRELEVGDNIIYLPHSDYEMEIEGKKYYVMKYWEIIAKY